MRKKSALPITVIDDEGDILHTYRLLLKRSGLPNVYCFHTGHEALSFVQENGTRLILLDLSLGGESGKDYLGYFQEEVPEVPVIIITGNQELETAVACMQAGAYDYLVKPIDENRLITTVTRALEWGDVEKENRRLKKGLLQGRPLSAGPFEPIVTQNAQMMNLLAYAEVVADSPKPVLITGESGTGKELLARAVHSAGCRAENPLVTVNVAGLEDDVFSDTLFGHVKGAYTGAQTARGGLIEQAGNGTLVLDEMGDLSMACQIKLLRLLQEREYYPLGADQPRKSNARIIAVTNLDLEKRVQEGTFRMDLFYRLCVHHLVVVPLRLRRDDLPLLVEHLVQKAASTLQVDVPNVDGEGLGCLCDMDFPGNVRELETLLFDAVTRYHIRGEVPLEFFRTRAASGRCRKGTSGSTDSGQKADVSLVSLQDHHSYRGWRVLPTLQQARSDLIAEALYRTEGNQAAAARMLGISPQALSKSLRKTD